jgi:formylglycine-generating enzyme
MVILNFAAYFFILSATMLPGMNLDKKEAGATQERNARLLPKMIRLSGGVFIMGGEDAGSAAPRHTIEISPFEIAETEVTQALYSKVMGYNLSHFKNPSKPEDAVSWYDAQEFCLRISLLGGVASSEQKIKLEQLLAKAGKDVRSAKYSSAMTEAEWEYAAKAGQQFRYGTSDGTISKDKAVYGGDKGTSTVKSKQPNPFGLYDMAGNVWEWCADIFDENFYKNQTRPKKDPVNLSPGIYCVQRGGGWFNREEFFRTSHRSGLGPEHRHENVGFRPARSATKELRLK